MLLALQRVGPITEDRVGRGRGEAVDGDGDRGRHEVERHDLRVRMLDRPTGRSRPG